MKLSTKLLLSYITIACLVLLVGVASFYLNEHIKNDLIEENRHSIEEMQRLSSLKFHLQNSLIFTRNYLFEREQEERPAEIEIQLQSRRAEEAAMNSLNSFSSQLEAFDRSELTDGEGRTFDQVHQDLGRFSDTLSASFEIYRSLLMDLFELEEETGMGDEIFNLTIEPYFRTTLLPILDQYQSQHENAIEMKMQSLEERVARNTWVMILMTSVAFVFAVALAYVLYNSIARPIRYLTRAAEDIGSGNLSRRIRINTEDELQQLGDSFNQMTENLNRSMVSREYVNSIIQSMGDMLVVVNSRYEIQLVNRSTTETLGYNESELEGSSIWKLFSDESASDLWSRLGDNREKESFESRMKAENGTEIPVLISYSSLERSAGVDPDDMVFVAGNITVQKAAEEKISQSLKEKEVLLSEIHHRVKNNLAVISGLLEMQVWNLDKGDASINPLKESQLRIQSIALVHELLYQSENFSEVQLDQYIRKLLTAIQKTHKNEEKVIDVQTELQSVSLTIQKAIPASLILNELVVNAYKHAFQEQDSGVISVMLNANNSEVSLTVKDNGIGLPVGFDPFSQKSLGMTLIKTLIRQIGAKFSIEPSNSRASGTVCSVTFKTDWTPG